MRSREYILGKFIKIGLFFKKFTEIDKFLKNYQHGKLC